MKCLLTPQYKEKPLALRVSLIMLTAPAFPRNILTTHKALTTSATLCQHPRACFCSGQYQSHFCCSPEDRVKRHRAGVYLRAILSAVSQRPPAAQTSEYSKQLHTSLDRSYTTSQLRDSDSVLSPERRYKPVKLTFSALI